MGGRAGWMVVAAVLATVMVQGRAARGALGDPDATFGDAGVVVTQFGQGAMPVSQATDVKVQPDGRIVVGGAATDALGNVALSLVRYLPSGEFDPSFGPGGSGFVNLQLGGGATPSSLILYSGLALQDDGNILGCGTATDTNGDSGLVIARFTSAGVLDPSFASGGKYAAQLGLAATPSTFLFGCKLQADGKIVAVGGRNDVLGNTEVYVLRLTAGGIPDPGFASGGFFTQQLSSSAMTPASVGADLVILADGKIVVSLALEDPAGATSLGVARLTAGGALDAGFGMGGFTLTSFGGATPFSEGVQVALQPTGKLIVSGDGDNASDNRAFVMARFTSGGVIDPSFGTDSGRTATQLSAAPTPSSTAIALAVAPNGKIVLAGSSDEIGGTAALAIARYTSEGVLDPSFGGSGIVKKQYGTGPTATTIAIGATLTSSGKLIVVGAAGPGGGGNVSWFIASFDADTPPTATFTVAPAAPVVGDTITLDASASTDADGTIASYAWDLDGDGQYDDASGATTTTSFTTGGGHTVGVLVGDDGGVLATATTVLAVGCGEAPTFVSVDCRIVGLLASVDAQVPAGALHDKLATALSTARSLEQAAAAAGPGKEARKNLGKAAKAIGKFMGGVRKGKKEIAAEVRSALLGTAKGVRSSLKKLRKA